MVKTISGHNLAGASSATGRVEHDYYATPPVTTKAILDKVKLTGSILEPACGEGHMSEVLKEYYPDSEVISTDLIDRGYGEGEVDFLEHEYTRTFDNVVTNPPFALAKEFIEKALSISNDKVIMFAKIQLLESMARRELFDEFPPKYVYVFSKRQAIWRNGEPLNEKGKPWANTMTFSWFVWEKGFTGEPIVRWL